MFGVIGEKFLFHTYIAGFGLSDIMVLVSFSIGLSFGMVVSKVDLGGGPDPPQTPPKFTSGVFISAEPF